jgi:nitronate monooxygenase
VTSRAHPHPRSDAPGFPARGERRVRELSRWPLVVAPMAGGPSTVELVAAAAEAGSLGFLAGGYKTAAGLADDMEAAAATGVDTFGVNLFVPGSPAADPDRVAAYVAGLEPDAVALGATLGEASWDDDDYAGKVDVLLAAPPAAVSFTFGVPDIDIVRSLQAAGSAVLLTVTTPEEAAQALRAGPDALCLQGSEAGAHRGSLANDDRPDQDRPVRALLAAVRRRTLVPLVAAGGVGGPEGVTDLLARGADLVQAGTAFLRCPESGAPAAAKDALADPTLGETAVTRAFSGRRARALVNTMLRDHPDAPAAYPEVNNATRPLRAAAARSGDVQHMSLYAGTAFRRAEARPAAEVVERLVSGLRR